MSCPKCGAGFGINAVKILIGDQWFHEDCVDAHFTDWAVRQLARMTERHKEVKEIGLEWQGQAIENADQLAKAEAKFKAAEARSDTYCKRFGDELVARRRAEAERDKYRAQLARALFEVKVELRANGMGAYNSKKLEDLLPILSTRPEAIAVVEVEDLIVRHDRSVFIEIEIPKGAKPPFTGVVLTRGGE